MSSKGIVIPGTPGAREEEGGRISGNFEGQLLIFGLQGDLENR